MLKIDSFRNVSKGFTLIKRKKTYKENQTRKVTVYVVYIYMLYNWIANCYFSFLDIFPTLNNFSRFVSLKKKPKCKIKN